MSNVMEFEFCELPLVIHNGIEAALINGMRGDQIRSQRTLGSR